MAGWRWAPWLHPRRWRYSWSFWCCSARASRRRWNRPRKKRARPCEPGSSFNRLTKSLLSRFGELASLAQGGQRVVADQAVVVLVHVDDVDLAAPHDDR